MGLDLQGDLHADLKRHLGHLIVCVSYGVDMANVALECINCNEVLVDADRPEQEEPDGGGVCFLW